jgi:hydroxymethylbilane synthase
MTTATLSQPAIELPIVFNLWRSSFTMMKNYDAKCLVVLVMTVLTLIPGAICLVVRVGTRPSPLAIQQAESVASALKKVHPFLETQFIILESSSEHKISINKASQEKPLAMSNVDFTGVIDEAIISRTVDIGVHSLKDIPPDAKWCTDSLTIAAFLPRACPLDVLIGAKSLESLPRKARVGSASTRRQSQLLSIRPDLQLVNLRGNVQTRIQYLHDGIVDAVVMARAGLNRLGVSSISDACCCKLSADEMLPGPGQGIVGIVCRKDNNVMLELLQAINDDHACIAATAERQVLSTVDSTIANKPYKGRPPLAAYMSCNDDLRWILKARLLRPDGTRMIQVEREAPQYVTNDDATILGIEVGNELVRRAGEHYFDEQIQ